mgnify:CR=1 FL=1
MGRGNGRLFVKKWYFQKISELKDLAESVKPMFNGFHDKQICASIEAITQVSLEELGRLNYAFNEHKNANQLQLERIDQQEVRIKSLEDMIYNLTTGMSELHHRLMQLERKQ